MRIDIVPDDTDTPAHADPLAYSVPDAAKAIGISERTMWELLRVRELRSFKLGHRTLIRAEELRSFIDRKAASLRS